MEQEKVEILLAALCERYESLRVIRSRVQEVALWTMGVFFGATGWLISTELVFKNSTKGAFIVALAIEFLAVRFSYLTDLEAGFKSQQAVAAKIENALGLFNDGEFDTPESIYPKSWSHAGRTNGRGNYFATTYLVIYVATGALAMTILSKGIIF